MTHEKQHLEKCRKDLRYRFRVTVDKDNRKIVNCNICGKRFHYWIAPGNKIECEEVK